MVEEQKERLEVGFDNLEDVEKELTKQANEASPFLNKEITFSHPITAEFDPGLIKLEDVDFVQKDGQKHRSKVWKFYTVNSRQFSTSHIKLAAEIVKALKDGLTVLTIGKKPAVDKDGKETNYMVFYLVGATMAPIGGNEL